MPATPRAKSAVPDVQSLDVGMLLGFVTTVLLVVLLIYRRDIVMATPMIAGCLAAAGVYGFMRNELLLGLILHCVCASELFQWIRKRRSRSLAPHVVASDQVRQETLYHSESRFNRMFGSTEA